ncbi:MAG: DUF3298 domain-containing protein [Parachlamydiaceae bacterium]|nr:DUF3298 domain-containing protein [Parachlamydiaceae bacterium]
MKKVMLHVLWLLILSSCNKQEPKTINIDNLTDLKIKFIEQIDSCCIDEGPFSFNYTFRTVLFSKHITSLFGELNVHDRLPHGWNRYEGKTFYKINDERKGINLNDLFTTDPQKEYLRKICEDEIKKEPISYFGGKDPSYITLNIKDIHTFVIDHQNLIIIFQPYIVGGAADGPFVVKIPFTQLIGKWQEGNPIEKLLPIDKNFLSSWDKDNWISDIQEGYSIAK